MPYTDVHFGFGGCRLNKSGMYVFIIRCLLIDGKPAVFWGETHVLTRMSWSHRHRIMTINYCLR